MGEDEEKSMKDWIKDKTEQVSNIAKKAKEEFDKSELGGKVSEQSKRAKKTLDEAGVTEKITALSSTASDHLDKISGAKLLEIVEQRLELQGKYNDILATKLAEALDRIQMLEDKLKGPNKG